MRVRKYEILLNEDRLPQMVKECGFLYGDRDTKLNTSRKVVNYLVTAENFSRLSTENLILLAFSNDMKLLGTFHVSTGTVNRALASPREIFMRALAVGAVFIIVAHNHPSGDPKFSEEDRVTAKRLADGGKILDVEIRDFIAVGNKKYCSMADDNGQNCLPIV